MLPLMVCFWGIWVGDISTRSRPARKGKQQREDPRTEAAKKINLCFVMLESDIITENLVWVGIEENGYRI